MEGTELDRSRPLSIMTESVGEVAADEDDKKLKEVFIKG